MEVDIHECGVCYNRYDIEVRVPMCLPQCRHTICKQCINHVLASPMAQCPFDRKRFFFYQDRTYLPPQVNIYARNSLQCHGGKYEECQQHREPLKYYCLTSKRNICGDCFAFGQHKNHQVMSLKDINSKLTKHKHLLGSCKGQLRDYVQSLTSLLEKRKFEELETVDNFHQEQEEILKKRKLEVKFKSYVAYNQAQKKLSGKASIVKNMIREKKTECRNIDHPKLGQIANEESEDFLLQFSRQKLFEETKTFQENLELKSDELHQCLVQQISREPALNWENYESQKGHQATKLEEPCATMQLSFKSSGYKIKNNFAITILDERLNITLTELPKEESMIDTEHLRHIKIVNIDIQSLWSNEEYLIPLGYIFNKLPQLRSLSFSCENFQVNDNLQPLERRLRTLLEVFFSKTHELKNIRIHWKAAYGANEIFQFLVKEFSLRKLELESLELCFEKDVLDFSIFQSLIQNLQSSQNSLETLKLIAIVSYCTREGTLNSLKMPKLKNLIWEVECSCQQCKESFHDMTRKFVLDCFKTMQSLEKLGFSLMITENLTEEGFVKIFELLRELKLLNELKIIMSDVGKGSLIKSNGLIKLVGYVVQHLSQMLKLETLCMGVKLGECHTLRTSHQILEFLGICLEQSMRYQ